MPPAAPGGLFPRVPLPQNGVNAESVTPTLLVLSCRPRCALQIENAVRLNGCHVDRRGPESPIPIERGRRKPRTGFSISRQRLGPGSFSFLEQLDTNAFRLIIHTAFQRRFETQLQRCAHFHGKLE